MKHRILILSDGIPPFVMGGMQKHTLNLTKFLTLSGNQVHLIHCHLFDKSKPSDEEVADEIFGQTSFPEGFTHQCLPFPAPGKIPGHYIRASKQFSEMVYDVVKNDIHVYDFVYIKGFAGWETLKAKGRGEHSVPTGVKFHGYEMFQKPPSFKTSLQLKMLRKPTIENNQLADYVFSYGGKINQIIESIGISRDKIVEIPGAVDSDWIDSGLQIKTVEPPIKVLFVGRFERRKGIQELTEAIKMYVKDKNDILFEFAGPIPEINRLKHPLVKYHGSISDKNEMRKIYQSNDVLICPSYSEGMPNVIMEAMSQGLAIIATDVGASQLLVKEETGWLLRDSSVESILKSLNQLTSDFDQIISKKQNASKLVAENFQWDKIIAKTNAFFTRIKSE